MQELRGLYLLTERISLHYCSKQLERELIQLGVFDEGEVKNQLERELIQLGVFDEGEVKRLTDGLQVFLDMVRSNSLQPIHLCTSEMLELWWQSLPEAFVWDQLKLMCSRGLDVA